MSCNNVFMLTVPENYGIVPVAEKNFLPQKRLGFCNREKQEKLVWEREKGNTAQSVLAGQISLLGG